MDFTFTDQQIMMRDALSRLLAQHYTFEKRQQILRSPSGRSEEIWREFREFGLLALPLPESVGGIDATASDIVAIGELFGRRLVVEPYLSSILLAGRALAKAEGHSSAADWLSKIAEGRALAAFAHEEGRGTADSRNILTTAEAGGGGYLLRGEKRLVLGGAEASILIVTARLAGESFGLLLVDPGAAGVVTTPYVAIDGRRAANIRFDGVAVPADALIAADAGETTAALVKDAMMALAAEAAGAMGALLEMTVVYAGTRKQFGVPIGSFQAIAHRLADMKLAYVKTNATLLYTAALADSGRAAARDYSLLKAQVGRLGRVLAEAAVQIHGGVGMTDELAVGHYMKRILAIAAMFGADDDHLRLIGGPSTAAT